jgi:flagellar capping protein FliD
MSTSSSSIFTGSSEFSSSLAQVIQKAVNNASIPINELKTQETTLSNQSDEVSTLNSKFSSLQSAIQELDSAANSSFSATVSDTSSVSADVGSGAAEGHYAINVISAGSYSTMMTDTWTAASGSAQTYQLYIGDAEYDVTGSDNSATSVAQAINTNYGSLVTATVVNVGSTASPDYRISLQGKTLSSDALDLKSSGTSLAKTQDNGKQLRQDRFQFNR